MELSRKTYDSAKLFWGDVFIDVDTKIPYYNPEQNCWRDNEVNKP